MVFVSIRLYPRRVKEIFVGAQDLLLDLGVTTGAGFNAVSEISSLGERLGYNRVWLGEDMHEPTDVFTAVSAVLLETSKIKVGIGITSPLTRNVTTIARASVSLAEIGGASRFTLGLGVGGLQDLAQLGIMVKNSSVMLQDAVFLLRKIWKSKKTRPITFKDEYFQLEDYFTRYGVDYDIPIYMGVRGPRLLYLAGQIADGVLLSGPKTYLQKAIKLVKDGIRKSENPQRPFGFAVWIPTILTEKKTDLNLANKIVAVVLSDASPSVLEMAQTETERIKRIRQALQASGLEKAAKLVTDDLVQETTIQGDAGQICDEFKSLEEWGFDEAVFGPPYGAESERAISLLAEAWRSRG